MSNFSDYVNSLAPKMWWRMNDDALPISDDFTGTDGYAPDKNNWLEPVITSGATASALINSNALEMKLIGNGASTWEKITVTGNFKVIGDFELEVSFSNLINLSHEGHSVRLYIVDGTYTALCQTVYTAANSNRFQCKVTGSSTDDNYYTRTNTYGGMRIKRTGTTAYVYYKDGTGSWTQGATQTITANPIDVDLVMTDFDDSTAETSCDLDDFVITSGSMSTVKEEINGYNAIYEDEPSLWQTGLVSNDTNKAVLFNGTSEYARVLSAGREELATYDTGTVSFLIKNPSGTGSVFSFSDNTQVTRYIWFSCSATNISFGYKNDTPTLGANYFYLITPHNLGLNEIALITIVQDDTLGALLYKNGELLSPTVNGTPSSKWFNANANYNSCRICSVEKSSGTEYNGGTVDEVLIFDKVLTSSQIATLSSYALTGSLPVSNFYNYMNSLSPYAWWRLGDSYYDAPADISDDFTGTNGQPPNTALWDSNLTGTPQIQSNQLDLSGIRSVRTLYGFIGNFDVEIFWDVSAGTWSNDDDVAIGAWQDNGIYFYISRDKTIGGVDQIRAQTNDGSASVTGANTWTSGYFRITLSTATITLYYKQNSGDSWSILTTFTATSTYFTYIGVWTTGTSSAIVDDFVHNSGSAADLRAKEEVSGYLSYYVKSPTIGENGLVHGDLDTSVLFDNVDDFIDVKDSDMDALINGTFTFSCLVNTGTMTQNGALISKRELGVGQFFVSIGSDKRPVVYFNDGTNNVSTTYNTYLDAGKIYYLCVVSDRTLDVSYMFINGIRQTDADISSIGSVSTINNLHIGRGNVHITSSTVKTFNGHIDEPVFFDKVLTDEEVYNLSQYALKGYVTPTTAWTTYINSLTPVAWWRLGEESGTVAYEEIAGYDGTYLNTPTLDQVSLVSGDYNSSAIFTNANSEGISLPASLVTELKTHSTGSVSFIKKVSSGTSDTTFCIADKDDTDIYITCNTNIINAYFIYRNNSGTPGSNYWTVYGAHGVAVGDLLHYVCVQDATEGALIYINGELISTTATATPSSKWFSAIAAFDSAGISYMDRSSTDLYSDGNIDEVMVFEDKLTASEIADMYALISTGEVVPEVPYEGTSEFADYMGSLLPVAWWRLGEPQDVIDISDSFDGNDGDSINSNLWSEPVGSFGISVFDADIQNNKFEISFTAINSDNAAGTHTLYSVTGDFEATIDSTIGGTSSNPHAYFLTSIATFAIYLRLNGGTYDIYTVFNGSASSGSIGQTDAKLKIKRTGSTGYVYYDIGAGWVLLKSGSVSTEDVRFSLNGRSYTSSGTVIVTHDNFTLVSGTVLNAIDETGSYDGTYMNEPVLGETGLVAFDPDTSIVLNQTGKEHGVKVEYIHSTDLTIIAIIKPTSLATANDNSIVYSGKTGLVYPSYNLLVNSDASHKLSFSLYKDNSSTDKITVISTTEVLLNTQYFVAVTFDDISGDLKLYLDGVLEDDDTWAYSIWSNTVDATTIGYSEANAATYNNFQGGMDEVAFFDRALTAEEILNLHNYALYGSSNITDADIDTGTSDNLPIDYNDGEITESTSTTITFVIPAGTVSVEKYDIPYLLTLDPYYSNDSGSFADIFLQLNNNYQRFYVDDGGVNLQLYIDSWDASAQRARIWIILDVFPTTDLTLTLDFDPTNTANPLSEFQIIVGT